MICFIVVKGLIVFYLDYCNIKSVYSGFFVVVIWLLNGKNFYNIVSFLCVGKIY